MSKPRTRRRVAAPENPDTPEEIEARYRLLFRKLKRYAIKLKVRAAQASALLPSSSIEEG